MSHVSQCLLDAVGLQQQASSATVLGTDEQIAHRSPALLRMATRRNMLGPLGCRQDLCSYSASSQWHLDAGDQVWTVFLLQHHRPELLQVFCNRSALLQSLVLAPFSALDGADDSKDWQRLYLF